MQVLGMRAARQTSGGWNASFQRAALWLLACAALALAAGCAQPSRPQVQASERTAWSGRLALQVQDQASQSFSAGFELQGSAANGELRLFTPLGSVLAIRLDKLPGKSGSDQHGAVWFAPAMQYLPVRIKLTQGQDDFVDLQLRKYLPAPQ